MITASAFAGFSVNADTHSGSCGEAAFWEFDEAAGILTISGSGDMADFPNSELVPWKDHSAKIKEAVITGGISSVGNNAFAYCEALEKVSLPESISKIGTYAFEFCTSLKSIKLPEKLTEISHYSFWLSALEELYIPEGVTSVGRFAFQSCEKLKLVVLPSTLTLIDSFAFNNCTALEKVYFRGSEDQWKKVEVGILNSELGKTVSHDKEHLYIGPCAEACDVCGHSRRAPHVYDDLYDNVCNICGHEKHYIKGDMDGNGLANADDAIYLLYYVFFSEDYFIEQPCDFDNSSNIDADDAIYLLYYVFFPEDYPIA